MLLYLPISPFEPVVYKNDQEIEGSSLTIKYGIKVLKLRLQNKDEKEPV